MDKSKFKKYVQVLLTEAVRINNGKEAYELIKNNKIGVKLDPSYKTAGEEIIPYFEKAINSAGANNAAFVIQLLVNKVPISQLKEVVNSDAFKEIVSCKNKPWAKEIPGYKEAIDFSSKEKYDQTKWHNLEKSLQEEGQRHGKKNKGSGDANEIINAYDDGTWSLQIPKSWNGEKAAAFYGKRGEKQRPTGWCTRTNINYYNDYTENNTKPLYIIRNWETGKAYQMAIRDNLVDFLDQDDVRGDEITKGDFTNIPDNLLRKIPYGENESMLDFKQAFRDAKNEIEEYNKSLKPKITKKEEAELIKKGYFKNASMTPGSAKWGKTEKITDKISKNVFLNFADIKSKPRVIDNPFSNVEGFRSVSLPKNIKSWDSKTKHNREDWKSNLITGVKNSNKYAKLTKHNGLYAAKYYYNDNPDCFVLFSLKNDKDVRKKDIEKRDYPNIFIDGTEYATNYNIKYYIKGEDNKIREVKKENTFKYYEPHVHEIIEVAYKDFGEDKTHERYAKNSESKELYQNHTNIVEKMSDIFEDEIVKATAPILKKYINDTGYETKSFISGQPFYKKGGFIPEKFDIYARKNTGTVFRLDFEKIPNTIKYKCVNFRDYDNVVKNEESLKHSLEDFINNKFIIYYSKIALKDPKLKYLRIINRDPKEKENKLHFEEFITNYFPY